MIEARSRIELDGSMIGKVLWGEREGFLMG
jgi:hypothetical protein